VGAFAFVFGFVFGFVFAFVSCFLLSLLLLPFSAFFLCALGACPPTATVGALLAAPTLTTNHSINRK
jgi:hypothetical protein